jgi:hypothetical protein
MVIDGVGTWCNVVISGVLVCVAEWRTVYVVWCYGGVTEWCCRVVMLSGDVTCWWCWCGDVVWWCCVVMLCGDVKSGFWWVWYWCGLWVMMLVWLLSGDVGVTFEWYVGVAFEWWYTVVSWETQWCWCDFWVDIGVDWYVSPSKGGGLRRVCNGSGSESFYDVLDDGIGQIFVLAGSYNSLLFSATSVFLKHIIPWNDKCS